MTKLSSFLEDEFIKGKVEETRGNFNRARTEYELAMRREILQRVNHCPCCFDGFFADVKARIREEALQNNFEPNVMEVLTRMSLTPVVTDEEDEDETRDVTGESIH